MKLSIDYLEALDIGDFDAADYITTQECAEIFLRRMSVEGNAVLIDTLKKL